MNKLLQNANIGPVGRVAAGYAFGKLICSPYTKPIKVCQHIERINLNVYLELGNRGGGGLESRFSSRGAGILSSG